MFLVTEVHPFVDGNGRMARVIDFTQRYSQAIRCSSLEEARRDLDTTRAFVDANEADEQGLRLRLPDA